MSNLKTIILSAILIVVFISIAHFFPMFSWFIPLLVIGLTIFLTAKTSLKPFYIILFVLITLISFDISFKLNTSSPNDSEGAGVANLLFIIMALMVTVIVFVTLIGKQKGKIIQLLLLCLLIPSVTYCYLTYFESLGLINYINTSSTKEIAVKNKVFLNDLKFSVNPIIYHDDTLKITDGWAEKQIIVNHERLIKKYDDTSTINYTIKLKSNKTFDKLDMYYKVNDKSMNGANHIDSIISFNSPSFTKNIMVYIFKMNENIKDDTIINKLTIK